MFQKGHSLTMNNLLMNQLLKLAFLALMVSLSISVNPQDVETSSMREIFSPTKSEALRNFAHVQMESESERTRHDEGREKDEKSKERWKTKYTVTRSREEATTQDHKTEGFQDYVDPTRFSRYAASREAGFPFPTSIRATMNSAKRLYINFFAFYLPDEASVNPECQRDLAALDYGIVHFEEFASAGEIWPLKLIDSWGKFGDGIMNGNLNFMGSFRECLSVSVFEDEADNADLLADFKGKYCTIRYQIHPDTNDTLVRNQRPGLRAPMISVLMRINLPILGYATCMPSTCTEQELKSSLQSALGHSGYDLQTVKCQTEDDHHDLQAGETFGIVFFSVIGIILLAASVIDVWADRHARRDFRNGSIKYLLVFSVPCNLRKLFHLETRKNPDIISPLHGMRFLSICWVVLGHQYAYSTSVVSNLAEIPEVANKEAFQMIANGDISVDTFFFMSGLLVCLALLKQLNTVRKFNILVYYVHRIVRLLPPIAICVAFLATISGFLVKGPLSWSYEEYFLKGCRHSWWVDVTFINNFFYPYLEQMNKQNEAASCLTHCWFTAVDMQIYLITPFMVLPLYFWKKKGVLLLGLWTAASIIIPAAITGALNLWPASMLIQDMEANLDFTHKIYLMPWCRAAPYIIGIWAGYAVFIARDSPTVTRMSMFQVSVGWAAATAIALSIVFGIAKYNKLATPDSIPQMSLVEAVLYGGFHRAVWGVVLAWIVLACHWGYGGPVNWFLSHPLWQPLSRLTYCIYLTSLPIQQILIASTITPSYYNNLIKIQETCGVMLIVIFVSVLLTLVSEAPILRLEKLILHTSTERRQTQSNRISTHQLTVEIDVKSDSEDEIANT